MQNFAILFCIHYSSFHQSSGSGSESGVWTQKPRKSKSAESDNNTGSNDEDDIGNTGLNARDGSDHGSGTQVSLMNTHANSLSFPSFGITTYEHSCN